MDMRRLREFTVIADLGNLSKASVHLNIGQPTLSKHVADLEAELGVKLFDRTPAGLTLTPGGEALLQRGRSLLLEYDAMVAEVRRLKRVESRTVSIASFAGYSPATTSSACSRASWPRHTPARSSRRATSSPSPSPASTACATAGSTSASRRCPAMPTWMAWCSASSSRTRWSPWYARDIRFQAGAA